MATVTNLGDGDDSYSVTPVAGGAIVHGNGGNDYLSVQYGPVTGEANVTTLDGGDGNDTLVGNFYGSVSYIGGAGTDTAQVQAYSPSYSYQLVDAGSAGVRIVPIGYDYADNSTYAQGIQTIDPSTEFVRFGNGQTLAYADLPLYVGANYIYASYVTTFQHLAGTDRYDRLYMNGNVDDYTVSRLADYTDPVSGTTHRGDYVLVATNGSGTYTIDDRVDGIQFQNGQFIAASQLQSVVAATPDTAPAIVDQQISAPYSGYQLALGGAGQDIVSMQGKLADYTVRSFTAQVADGPETIASHAQSYSGLELVSKNGSGEILIGPDVENIRFTSDGLVAYGDLLARVAASSTPADVLHIALPDNVYGPLTFAGDASNDRLLLNAGNYGFTVSRDAAGDFVLTSSFTYGVQTYSDPYTIIIGQSIETVQLQGVAQPFALGDITRYVRGDATFTAGTDANDILVAGKNGGDQYLVGGAGRDAAYLNGNVGDYAVLAVDQGATGTNPAIHGYELVALNNSGNIYIDGTTEIIHMQNGQSFTLFDLPGFIDHYAPAGAPGTAGNDVFVQQITGDQYFVGAAGTDTVYLHGNVNDYAIHTIDLAATAAHPAIHGYALDAVNGSGNLFIDATTESVHFQNGLYASYGALGTFATDVHA